MKKIFLVILILIFVILGFLFINNKYEKFKITSIQNKELSKIPFITKVFGPLDSSSKYGPEGFITAGKVASFYGSNLIGDLTVTFSPTFGTPGLRKEIKTNNDGIGLKDNVVYDNYIELIVPEDIKYSPVNITITNKFGTSLPYKAKIN